MKLQLFQIDAFAERRFEGNPAAVCPLAEWLPDAQLQSIAAENNLSETAFLVPATSDNHLPRFQIRWFTPLVEVDLCGHATLASAHALMSHLGIRHDRVEFESPRSGSLACWKSEFGYTLDFPSRPPQPVDFPVGLAKALGGAPQDCFQGGEDYLVRYASEREVAGLKPDFFALEQVETRGIIATARGDETSFVSRFFGPRVGIDEDPVTGSAHTLLTPFWLQQDPSLGENGEWLAARQLSERGGRLRCRVEKDRVHIAGSAVTYLVGEIELDD